jgi:outer membrane protein OmpA-like peptidoglycan-associated protein
MERRREALSAWIMRYRPMMKKSWLVGWIALAGCGGGVPASTLTLDRVVLFQNGIGYFERHGQVDGTSARMVFSPYELDDVLKTVTVLDSDAASVAGVEVGEPAKGAKQVPVTVRLSAPGRHRLNVSYAVPTPTWKPSYRIVLDEPGPGRAGGLLQGWATINNTSGEDWMGVRLALAAGAPFSYAMDLRSPTYVSRPDVNGVMISPVVTAAVGAEGAAADATDRDGDGVKNGADSCPNDAEDRDDHEDTDGCPDLDNDQDRIPDRQDKCPDDAETYNGYEDDDGCPDRGRVVVTESDVEVLDNIYFKKGSAALEESSSAILDAIAETLRNNPTILLLEVQGHASDDEPHGWELSSQRSAAIIMALRERGVDPRRLTPQGYGATQPMQRGTIEATRAPNRRGGFLILQRGEAAQATKAGEVTSANVAASARAQTRPVEIAGASRYDFATPMTIPRGGATMVSIINQPVDAEEIYLFRPDPAARGSDVHPFRAIRLTNSTKFTLQPGAVAVFARKTYVGDGLLSSLAPGAMTFAPYAVDEGASVTSQQTSDDLPLRVVSLRRSTITLEVAHRLLTRYDLAPSAAPPARIFLRHVKAVGYEVQEVPPGSIDQGDAWLIAVPMSAAKASSYVVEERLAQRRPFELTSRQLPELTLYLAGSHLPELDATALRAALSQRDEVRKREDALDEVRARYNDQLDRATETRSSLAALGSSAEGAGLRKKLAADLATIISAMDSLTREIAQRRREQVTAEAKLRELIRDLVIEAPK